MCMIQFAACEDSSSTLCGDVKMVLSCFAWSPEGGLSTPRYSKEEVMGSYLIVTMEEVAEDFIRIEWLLLPFMIGKPSGGSPN